MDISPVFTILMGHILTATPSPRGNFWKVTIDDIPGVAFFGNTATDAFYKARLYVVAHEAGETA